MLDKLIIPVIVVSALSGICVGYKIFSETVEKEVPIIVYKTEYLFIDTAKVTALSVAKKVTKRVRKPDGTRIDTVTEEVTKQNENTSVNIRVDTDTTTVPVLRDNYTIGFGLRNVRDSSSIYITGGINIVGGIWGSMMVTPLKKELGLGLSIQF